MTVRKPIRPRIIIHGGAGNITEENLPPKRYNEFRSALLSILHSASSRLAKPASHALDVATHAVSLLENNPLFNAGKGAVFTRAGTLELEASVMVSRGFQKRGVGCMGLKRVKNPIQLARELLIRGEEENGGGGQGHCQLAGPYLEGLAEEWGLDMVDERYHWTRRRWEEHKRGLEKERSGDAVLSEYLAQGTVGAVVLDSSGTLCVATSTGGLTNKLPGRIGDTPTLGAGFWAEEWSDETDRRRAAAMSGTGNGDSFLRLNAVRTASAIAHYSHQRLQAAVTQVAGPNGDLQKSAGDRWHKTGEGEGGMIGIELNDREGNVVFDFNCGGMFRAWVDDRGQSRFLVFRHGREHHGS
ncbi:N-terminal nucleophile aminohydrolase [Viridothelium virens]|uniref:N-terminal nucleophile aminohydrolase n=1 Tax=Viridothelium virens TaxID=1048519 RepID=A0A6A6HNB2_VIRVR|nr:N-terminal nucleophile aminohydrolase [Viridothelium virens]